MLYKLHEKQGDALGRTWKGAIVTYKETSQYETISHIILLQQI
jgi:hypothetical protein